MRLFGLTFSIMAMVVFTATSAMAERRLALVVGNSDYRNTPSLANPKNDAGAMAEALQRLGFEVIRGIDLSADGMRRTVRQFAGALQAADVALFYYAGHGLQVNGQNYLVPVDAKMRSSLDLEFEATNLQVVIDLMEREAKTNLVFLDACRDNPLARTLARSLGASRSTTIGQGLARIESGIGTLIAYATEPGNVALDGDGRHSPFTEALLQHIKTPGLEVGRMLRRVRSTVLKKTKGKQVPWEHTSLIGDFYFGSPPAIASAPAAAPSKPASPAYNPWQVELAIWESIKQSRNAADFESYLRQYPKGAFAAWARTRIADLKREKILARRPAPPRAKPAPPTKSVAKPSPQPKTAQSAPEPFMAKTAKAENPNNRAEITARLQNRIEALKEEGPHGDCSIQIHATRDRDQVAWDECEDRTGTIAALERRMKQELAALGTPRPTVSAAPGAGPGKILSKTEIREAVIGNTLNFRALRSRQDLFVYFAKDGTVDVRGSAMSRTVRKVWFFNKLSMLCRTVGPENKNHCMRVARNDDSAKLELSNPRAGVRYEATILKGRQLPE